MSFYSRHRHNIQLAAVLLTVLAAVSHRWLPLKTYEITGSKGHTQLNLYSGKGYEYGEEADWVDKDAMKMRCTITPASEKAACGLDIAFYEWPKWENGINLHNYDTVHLDIDYQGSASKIRFYARNFHPDYSNVGDFNSTKYNTINLRTRDLAQPVDVPLSALVVADWWLDQFDIPLAQSHLDFSNITGMGFDFGSPIPYGVHTIHFKKIVFKGHYISSASWYLIIMGIWMLTIAAKTVRRLLYLREKNRRYLQRVSMLEADKNQLQNKADKFEELSTTDSLTGAYNRFGIDRIINNLFEQQAPELPLTIIIADIDHFKRINDTEGHAVGDKVLSKLGRTILANIRENDFLGRWGGEEFIIICTHTDAQHSFLLAEKLRLLIEGTQFDLENSTNSPRLNQQLHPQLHPQLKVTASFGVGEVQAGETFTETFNRADSALYEAKKQGRNCTVLAQHTNV